jgi:positive regulator of sigma E activity
MMQGSRLIQSGLLWYVSPLCNMTSASIAKKHVQLVKPVPLLIRPLLLSMLNFIYLSADSRQFELAGHKQKNVMLRHYAQSLVPLS